MLRSIPRSRVLGSRAGYGPRGGSRYAFRAVRTVVVRVCIDLGLGLHVLICLARYGFYKCLGDLVVAGGVLAKRGSANVFVAQSRPVSAMAACAARWSDRGQQSGSDGFRHFRIRESV